MAREPCGAQASKVYVGQGCGLYVPILWLSSCVHDCSALLVANVSIVVDTEEGLKEKEKELASLHKTDRQ